jgi:hypothetical protein
MELLTPTSLAALASGLVVGFLLTVFGGGGSVLATPLLLYFVGVSDPHLAIGTSAAAVTVNALMGLSAQARAGRVKWPCALVFGDAGLAGSVAGSTLAKHIDGQKLLLAFAVAMAAVALSMLWPRRTEGDPNVHLTPRADGAAGAPGPGRRVRRGVLRHRWWLPDRTRADGGHRHDLGKCGGLVPRFCQPVRRGDLPELRGLRLGGRPLVSAHDRRRGPRRRPGLARGRVPGPLRQGGAARLRGTDPGDRGLRRRKGVWRDGLRRSLPGSA